MLLGRCRHCGADGQRYYQRDQRYKHRALTCFTCGCIHSYIDVHRPRVHRAGRPPTQEEMDERNEYARTLLENRQEGRLAQPAGAQ